MPNLYISNVFDLDGVPLRSGNNEYFARLSTIGVVSPVILVVGFSDKADLLTRSDHSIIVAYSNHLGI